MEIPQVLQHKMSMCWKSVPNSSCLSQGNYFAWFFLLSQLEGRLAGSSQTEQEGSQHSWVWASPPLWGASTLAWCLRQPSWSGEVRKLSRTCCYESSAASLLFVLLFSEHWKVSAGDTFSLVLSQQWKGLPAWLFCRNLKDTRIRGGTLPALIRIYFQHALINRIWSYL